MGAGARERAPAPDPRPNILVVLTDDQFIDGLKGNPAYKHLDIAHELDRMDGWLRFASLLIALAVVLVLGFIRFRQDRSAGSQESEEAPSRAA